MPSVMLDRCCICHETREQHLARRPQWQCAAPYAPARFIPTPACPRCDSTAKVDTGPLSPRFFSDGTQGHGCAACGMGFTVDRAGVARWS